jgi:hypothetical protein
VNSEFNDYHPAISASGLSLYITTDRPVGFDPVVTERIWVSQRPSLDAPWGPPHELGPNINNVPPAGGACCPNLSPDGHWLYFAGGGGPSTDFVGDELWVSHREDTNDDFGWEPPVNLGERVNTPHEPRFDECAPTFFDDEETGITTLYFCRNPGGLGGYDIYATTLRLDGVFGIPALVWELSSPQRDTRTAIRRDGLEMFITSNRPGGLGANDVWGSTRETTQDAWSTPVNLGAPVNSEFQDGGPALSCDGTTMYFFSERPGGFGGRDLYVTYRHRLDHHP